MRSLKFNIIAIVYDFDGTLTPLPMQEYTILPKIGISGPDFWKKVKKENDRIQGEMINTYMRLLLEEAEKKRVPIKRELLGESAKNIKYFPGVKTFFERINQYINDTTSGEIKLRHYIISSGLKEILEKTPIYNYFYNVFASEYYYDHYGRAIFPKIAICDTLKTQFLFRINKGKEDMRESINTHMPIHERPIPFENILYIGDGLTDVPCMSVTKKNNGYTIAVYQSNKEETIKVCEELIIGERVDFVVEADYRKSSELEKIVKLTLDTMIQGIYFKNGKRKNIAKYFKRGTKNEEKN